MPRKPGAFAMRRYARRQLAKAASDRARRKRQALEQARRRPTEADAGTFGAELLRALLDDHRRPRQ